MENYGIISLTFGVTIKSVIFGAIMAVTITIPVSWNGYFCEQVPKFRRNLLPPSSEQESKSRKRELCIYEV
jgi:hypothetical protein